MFSIPQKPEAGANALGSSSAMSGELRKVICRCLESGENFSGVAGAFAFPNVFFWAQFFWQFPQAWKISEAPAKPTFKETYEARLKCDPCQSKWLSPIAGADVCWVWWCFSSGGTSRAL